MASAEEAVPNGDKEPPQKDSAAKTEPKTQSKPNGPPPEPAQQDARPPAMAMETVELDDFGLPIRRFPLPVSETQYATSPDQDEEKPRGLRRWSFRRRSTSASTHSHNARADNSSSRASSASRRQSLKGADSDADEFEDAVSKPASEAPSTHTDTIPEEPRTPLPPKDRTEATEVPQGKQESEASHKAAGGVQQVPADGKDASPAAKKDLAKEHARDTSIASTAGTGVAISEFSHQQLTTEKAEKQEDGDGEWQTMPAYARFDMYDDDDKLIAKEHDESEDETYKYAGLGGAGRGYTRVLVDDDAQSATSMDDNTHYLFNKTAGDTSIMDDDEEQQRDAVSQLQATKDLLTEGQRIAYVGVTRLELSAMTKTAEGIEYTRKTKKDVQLSSESLRMWSQKMMIRLYTHMDISPAEQIMIEQLSEHGVQPQDLTPILMANARVKNPMAEGSSPGSASISGDKSPREPASSPKPPETEEVATPPPAYEAHESKELDVKSPSQLPTTAKIDIDLRWTVLCDLFLVLIADSVYDSRSRVLLEKVAASLDVTWVDICRFEKKVTDALEMQQSAEKENWNEAEHMENRRKMALKKRYVMMGLATVGGGLVIGLSAGLLAPMIGAGLAAGFTTIGVTGTSSFLAGAGGAAIITSGAAASGSVIGVRAADRRTGAVKTFEYRPLHNNKRVNLIVTVSGWMTGKVDDVRLPYSTVDPLMGDIYSVLWEPEMLTSMGDTINILATEVSRPVLSDARVRPLTFPGADTGSPTNTGQYHLGLPNGRPAATGRPDQAVVSHRQPLGRLPRSRDRSGPDSRRLPHRAQPRHPPHHPGGLLAGIPCYFFLPPGARSEGRVRNCPKRLPVWRTRRCEVGRIPASADRDIGPLHQRLSPQRLDLGLPVPADQRRHSSGRGPGGGRRRPRPGERGPVGRGQGSHGVPHRDAAAAQKMRLAGRERRVHRD